MSVVDILQILSACTHVDTIGHYHTVLHIAQQGGPLRLCCIELLISCTDMFHFKN